MLPSSMGPGGPRPSRGSCQSAGCRPSAASSPVGKGGLPVACPQGGARRPRTSAGAPTSSLRSSSPSVSPSKSLRLPGVNLSAVLDMGGLAEAKEGEQLKSIENFDGERPVAPGQVVFNSPRTIHACLRLGISPYDLIKTPPKPDPRIDPAVFELRYTHQEQRRLQKIKAVREEREARIQEELEELPRLEAKSESGMGAVEELHRREELQLADRKSVGVGKEGRSRWSP
eukprot:RCo026747